MPVFRSRFKNMKCLKWITAVTFSVLSLNALATNVSGEEIIDNYIGAGHSSDVNGYTSRYDIDKMLVSRDGTTLSVDIFTSFYNDVNRNDIKLGDLFMAADEDLNGTATSPWNPNGNQPNKGDRYTDSATDSNTGTDWNYVYDLSGARNSMSGTGQLKSGFGSNQVVSSSYLHGTSSRDNQAVMLADRNSDIVHDSSSWSVDNRASYQKTNPYNTSRSIGYGKVSFSFDVSGTALATANQIAFRWAMTCANDIIEGVASFTPQGGGSTPVPEPETIVLMLLAMAGFTYRRKVKN
ncbi:MAG: hypothetical protein ACI9N3_001090 [Colwellia sp.]|jgi:hypothetical protein